MRKITPLRYLVLGLAGTLSLGLLAAYASGVIGLGELERAERMSLREIFDYRQSRYLLVDPIGDYAILRRTRNAERAIISVLQGKEKMGLEKPYPGNESEATDAVSIESPSVIPAEASVEDGSSFQGRDNPVRRKGFARMLTQVIAEERLRGIEPSYGTPHRWSPAFLKKYGHTEVARFSKILTLLAQGYTRAYMRTDREEELHAWMVAQPEKSITLPELFRASYRLTEGDVYLALLSIENLMAQQWRLKDREKLPMIRRLKPITSGYRYDGDRFGTWYHLFGMMLYGYVADGFRAGLVGRIEALGSNILSPTLNQTQKQWFNVKGGLVGEDLKEIILKKKYLDHRLDPELLREEAYLDRSEDFRDRIPVKLEPGLSASLILEGDNGDRLTSVRVESEGLELSDCKVELMYDRGFGFDSSFKVTDQRVSVRKARPLRIPSNGVQIRAVRGIFSGCQGVEREIFFEAR